MALFDIFKKRTRVAELAYNRYLALHSRNPRPRFAQLVASGHVLDADGDALERERLYFLLAIWFVLAREYLGAVEDSADFAIAGEFAMGFQLALERLGVPANQSSAEAISIAKQVTELVVQSHHQGADMPLRNDALFLLSYTFVSRVLGQRPDGKRERWSSLLTAFARDECAAARIELAELTRERRFVLS